MKEIKDYLMVGNAKSLPFADNSFDLVISINTIHNLDLNDSNETADLKNSYISS